MDQQNTYIRKPHWLKIHLPGGDAFAEVKRTIRTHRLNTVCQSARCPNIGDCWGRHTAAFMIMGSRCTRNCAFCAVPGGKPQALDPNEPESIANAANALDLHYVVVTSVTRDDLSDGGAAHFALTIKALRKKLPDCKIEVLIPDLRGDRKALNIILNARPDILNHNMETVHQLYARVRPQADYSRSLQVIKQAADFGLLCKSGLMVGLGESSQQLLTTMQDLLDAGCSMLTIGQYLQPGKRNLPVRRYVPIAEFIQLKQQGMEMGYKSIEAGPLVRSSYHAERQYLSEEKDVQQNALPITN